MDAEVVFGQFSEMFDRIEHQLHQWVKAAVDSTLDDFGTVGARAVEEFWARPKQVGRRVWLARMR